MEKKLKKEKTKILILNCVLIVLVSVLFVLVGNLYLILKEEISLLWTIWGILFAIFSFIYAYIIKDIKESIEYITQIDEENEIHEFRCMIIRNKERVNCFVTNLVAFLFGCFIITILKWCGIDGNYVLDIICSLMCGVLATSIIYLVSIIQAVFRQDVSEFIKQCKYKALVNKSKSNEDSKSTHQQ